MKLIYLDTSHLDTLAREYRLNARRVDKFIALWRENDYMLAVSKVHFEETMGLKFSESIDSRFDLLEAILPFRYEPDNFFEREIVLALHAKGFVLKSESSDDTITRFFSLSVSSSQELQTIKMAFNAIRNIGVYKMMAAAKRASWKANAEGQTRRSKQPRTEDLSRRFFGRLFFKFTGAFGSEEPKFGERRKTLASFLEQFHFRLRVKFTLRNLFGVSVLNKQLDKSVVNQLTISDCKGLWLRNEVERCLKWAGDFESSNENDLNHLQYLPYVDIFMSDKRIIDKLNQVFKQNKSVEWLEALNEPLKAKNTLESLEAALFNN